MLFPVMKINQAYAMCDMGEGFWMVKSKETFKMAQFKYLWLLKKMC